MNHRRKFLHFQSIFHKRTDRNFHKDWLFRRDFEVKNWLEKISMNRCFFVHLKSVWPASIQYGVKHRSSVWLVWTRRFSWVFLWLRSIPNNIDKIIVAMKRMTMITDKNIGDKILIRFCSIDTSLKCSSIEKYFLFYWSLEIFSDLIYWSLVLFIDIQFVD